MLAKEKGTSFGSGNFMRNDEANSSKNKRNFTGDSKAGKKNSPSGDNLFYSFCVSNFIPTNLLSLMLTKEKRKTYASSREKSEARNES